MISQRGPNESVTGTCTLLGNLMIRCPVLLYICVRSEKGSNQVRLTLERSVTHSSSARCTEQLDRLVMSMFRPPYRSESAFISYLKTGF